MRALILLSCLLAAAAFTADAPASAQTGAPQTSKAHASKAKPKITVRVTRRSTGRYGFLPGYRQPPNLSDPYAPRRSDPYAGTYPWYGWAGFYRGRWNGGGFGPCYTKTPIGPMWNCG